MINILLLSAPFPVVSDTLGCFWGGGHRCGGCFPDYHGGRCREQPRSWCDPPSDYLDEAIVFYDNGYGDDLDVCKSYQQVVTLQSNDITPEQLYDVDNGVPAVSAAITKVVYGAAGHFGLSDDCTTDVLKSGITGGDLQQCMNEFLFSQGESALERAACNMLSGEVLAPFCESKLFSAAAGVVNSYVNKFIEQPIVSAMTHVEDAASHVARSFANWFRGLFSEQALRMAGLLREKIANTTQAQVVV